jgi:hypothetical protein
MNPRAIRAVREIINRAVEDAVLVVLPDGSVAELTRGAYGGWLWRGDPIDGPALWCYKIEELRDESERQRVEELARRAEEFKIMAEEASRLGVEPPEPAVKALRLYFRPALLIPIKRAERYAVYSAEPRPEDVVATAALLYYDYWYSRRGRCINGTHNICGKERRLETMLRSRGLGMAVRVPVDSQLEQYLARALQPGIEIEPEETEAGEEAGAPHVEIAVAEPRPPELEVELEEAPAHHSPPQAAAPQRQELVPVYLLAMHLPTEDVVAVHRTESGVDGAKRIKEWSGERAKLAREIESLRRQAYRKIERSWCMVREFGVWVTVSESGVREAEELGREVRERMQKLGLGDIAQRYYVRAIRAYFEPGDARTLLDAAVAQLRGEIEELERKIKDAETAQNKRLVRELSRRREYIQALLETFRKYAERL